MICLDSSVAVKLGIKEELSDSAKALYRATRSSLEPIVAPPLVPLEVTNVVRQQMRGITGVSLADAARLLEDYLALETAIHNPGGLHQRALYLAHGYGLPATYDAHYLALADIMACEFWTADVRLIRRVGNDLPFLQWLGNYGVP